ncbi:MAG: DUF2804 domain-containing protein [Natrialbaceae archaeon]|nr:DUF2804 domain-containing protein [Natrialbaceae archaeon]
MSLPRAPAEPVGPDGPRFGTYRGTVERTALAAGDRGATMLTRWLREKQWQYVAVADDRLAVGGAIVDAGLLGSPFWWALDRETGELRVDRSGVTLSPAISHAETPTAGRQATVRWARDPITIDRSAAQLTVTGSSGPLSLDLELLADPAEAATAICPVAGGHPAALNVTQKEVTSAVSGSATIGSRRHTFDGAVGLLDHTHGLLARETEWEWAMGCGEHDGSRIGFNLVSGFNDGLENVCWIGETVMELGAARFDQDEQCWRVRTADDRLDLTLDVEAERTENTDVGIVASAYRQPIGAWSGTIDGRSVEGLYGVAEDHRARW